MNDNISNNKIINTNIKNNISFNNNTNNNNMSNNNNNMINNNNDKQKNMRHQEKISQNGSVKSSDTSTDVSNRVFIAGDNIVKHIRGYELSRKMENFKVYFKSFSGATVMCIEDYVKPTQREMPTHIILHVGKDEVSNKKPKIKLPSILLI